MKTLRVVAIIVVAAVSLAVLPKLQALPYFGPQMPPAPPARPAMASIDVVPEPPEPPEPLAPPERWSDGHDGSTYVLSTGDINMVNGDGDTDVSAFRRAYGRRFFWFRHDGRA